VLLSLFAMFRTPGAYWLDLGFGKPDQLQDLSWNIVSDLSPLHSLTALTNLNLGRNLATDIGPLASLHRLQVLVLAGTQISSISALASNTPYIYSAGLS
jgi:Leucine-rich repeat (LRR) protein